MIVAIMFCLAIGVLELTVWYKYRNEEDLFLITAGFGTAMFLIVLMMNGVGS